MHTVVAAVRLRQQRPGKEAARKLVPLVPATDGPSARPPVPRRPSDQVTSDDLLYDAVVGGPRALTLIERAGGWDGDDGDSKDRQSREKDDGTEHQGHEAAAHAPYHDDSCIRVDARKVLPVCLPLHEMRCLLKETSERHAPHINRRTLTPLTHTLCSHFVPST